MKQKSNYNSYKYHPKQKNDKKEQPYIIKDIDDLIFADENPKTHSER